MNHFSIHRHTYHLDRKNVFENICPGLPFKPLELYKDSLDNQEVSISVGFILSSNLVILVICQYLNISGANITLISSRSSIFISRLTVICANNLPFFSSVILIHLVAIIEVELGFLENILASKLTFLGNQLSIAE